ncbi:FAD-dependent oxidoreductase [Porphyrobacter algicida]|uniref:FAD-dependent oxidoreductase n=1 Tax=Qipengyuania algicida TaxID=1836209 RepID=A0A845AIM1_9SPHN|nr:NAD(P)/FAD-dependent oxidoreductase [Qipengyuania algicida]MXP29287.1 FAD-dependent oxidoreductase [Qipengyuania algicida]
MTNSIHHYDVAIIGGGPAGQAAALVLDQNGARIAVIDEQQRPGGQILRQPPQEFAMAQSMKGKSYTSLKSQLRAFEALNRCDWIGGKSVIGIDRSGGTVDLTLASGDGITQVSANRLLIASGCYDLPIPIPGWTLPGAMGAGGLQALVKAQAVVPDGRVLLAGTHPLMLIVATQVIAAGGTVAEVAFDQRQSFLARLLIKGAGTALRNFGLMLDAASAWATLRRAGVPVTFGQRLSVIEGLNRVSSARIGKRTVHCDAVGLCYGFLPQSDLPRLAGLSVRWAQPTGGWAAEHDGWMRSSVSQIFVAGETSGVAGAPAALLEGQIAGAGIALDLGLIPMDEAEAIRRDAARKQIRVSRFAALLDRIADPTSALTALRDANTILCRCEDVTIGAVETALIQDSDPNSVKLVTRCGMGTCQGRGCEHMLLRLAAHKRGVGPNELRGFTSRFPVRPTRIGDLIG